MTERTARRLAHGLWIATGALWLTAVVLVIAASPNGPSDLITAIVAGVPMAIYGSVGALVARTSPRNPIGWLLSAVGLALAVWMATVAYAQVGLEPPATIGSLPGATALAWVGALSLFAVLPVTLPLFLLYFPDGHLRSRRWRPVLWLTIAGAALTVLGGFAQPWDLDPVRLTPPAWMPTAGLWDQLYWLGSLLILTTSFAGLLALILRYRETNPQQRQPLRLLVWMFAAMAIATTSAFLVGLASGGADWAWIVVGSAIVLDLFGVLFGIPLAAAAAVLTFGLFDVGVVMKKTVVYVLLVISFLLVLGFIGFILSPATFAGSDLGSSPAAARIATTLAIWVVILAIAFRPVKGLARKIVYGKRTTPYEAMTEFSERLGDAYSTDDVLPRMAAIVRASTGAEVARVWLHVGRELRPIAAAPPEAEELPPVPVADDQETLVEGLHVFPVRDRGELLGALTVSMPAAEPLSKTGEKLVGDLASQAGLVLRNVRLVEELQESRRRIVTAQDERARKLERDLHDGAQQQLVALSVKLGLAEQLSARDPEKARALLTELKAEATDALDNLRDLARGIYPPVLADHGLPAALEAQLRKAAIPARLETDGTGRYPQEIEAAVYFCCLEALQNVTKYANARSVVIAITQQDGHLRFEVVDDGEGFEVDGAHGSGLTNMRDRVEALGGSLRVASEPGAGTKVSGEIPIGGER